MAYNFVPEMHDLGKLIPSDWQGCPTVDGEKAKWHGKGAFSNVDWAKLDLPEPGTATWQGIVRHHEEEYGDLGTSSAEGPLKADILLLKIADQLAATTARAVAEALPLSEEHRWTAVHKLWSPKDEPSEDLQWSPVRSIEDFKELLALVNGDPADATPFFARYGSYLQAIPEEKRPPNVVTSLYTHCQLTGKFYRILKRHVQVVLDQGEPVALEYAGDRATVQREIRDRWRFQLLKCQLAFPQTPMRARDLNVFYFLDEGLEMLRNAGYEDYLLFNTTDTLWFFLPLDGEPTEGSILKPYLDHSFYFETERTVSNLDNLIPDFRGWERDHRPERFRAKFGEAKQGLERELERQESRYARVQEELQRATAEQKERLGREAGRISHQMGQLRRDIEKWDEALRRWEDEYEKVVQNVTFEEGSLFAEFITASPTLATDTICELCQTRPAERLWVDEESGIVEHLCDICYGFREEGDRFGKIAKWEAEELEARLAWVKLHLDYDWANFYLRLLFEEFVEQFPAPLEERERRKAELRPLALLSDLTRDYREMAAGLYRALLESGIGEERMEAITAAVKDFYIIKLESLAEVRTILRLFQEHLRRSFGKCLIDSPVRISISVGQVKSPFHEHWRFLKRPRVDRTGEGEREQLPPPDGGGRAPDRKPKANGGRAARLSRS